MRPGAHYGFDRSILDSYTEAEVESQLRSIPIISIVMHPDDLFGYQAPSGRLGIYANSTEEGRSWERACSVEWIDSNGGDEFQVDCGIRVQGGSGTNVNQRAQLSFSLRFRSEYGPSKLQFEPLRTRRSVNTTN